ncbi:MAG: hypothetical protein ABSF59_01075 [Candidatus Sulfotelmatobacter sp.]|jgi:hypothetical protein
MNSDCPSTPKPAYQDNELKAPSSRLTDEKISDDTGTEAQSDSALRPAGLRNPFWK